MRRLGCRLPNMGTLPHRQGLGTMASIAEQAGAHALHLSDHVVLPEKTDSKYPFTPDGIFPFPPDSDWYDVFISCAWAAAATTTIEVGPSVLVLPQRHPLEVAKLASTLSQLSSGRFFLGVGAGWLREEFEALDKDFDDRAAVMLESIDILRLAWSGSGAGYSGEHLRVAEGTHCRPTPLRGNVPVLMGGMSNAALRRAARHADGWIALISAHADLSGVRMKLGKLHDYRHDHEATAPFRAVVRVMNYSGDAEATADRLHQLWELGFDEVVIDPGWEDLDSAADLIETCRRACDDA